MSRNAVVARYLEKREEYYRVYAQNDRSVESVRAELETISEELLSFAQATIVKCKELPGFEQHARALSTLNDHTLREGVLDAIVRVYS